MAGEVIMPELVFCLEGVADPCGRRKLPVDNEDNTNDPRAVAVGKCGVVGHVPRACSLTSTINEDS